MFSVIICRLLSKAPCAIPLRLQTHRLHNRISPTYRFQQAQRYYSPRRQNRQDESLKQQSSGLYDRVVSHFNRNEMTYANIGLGPTVFVAFMEAYGPEPPKPEQPPWVMSDMATISLINPIPGFW